MTNTISARFATLGEPLPQPWAVPSDANIPASLVRIVGNQAWVSGHIPTSPEGNPTGPFGKVGEDVTPDEARYLAVRTVLSICASLHQQLGSLDRVAAWAELTCMVNASDSFTNYPSLFNPASALLKDAFGEGSGDHARVAVGMAGLPWNAAVEISATIQLR